MRGFQFRFAKTRQPTPGVYDLAIEYPTGLPLFWFDGIAGPRGFAGQPPDPIQPPQVAYTAKNVSAVSIGANGVVSGSIYTQPLISF